MKTTLLDHITIKAVRDVLNGDISEDSICQALKATEDAFMEDLNNPLISDDVIGQREVALEAARHYWNEEGDGFATADAIELFWCGGGE